MKARKGKKTLDFVRPLKPDSPCLSCHNLARGCCKGHPLSDIITTLNGSDEKQAQWNRELETYEEALDESPSGRVSKMDVKFKPLVIITAFKESSRNARMVLPSFWPADVW